MAITITIDNDRVLAGTQDLIEDESLGVQTPAGTATPPSADTGNEIDVTLGGGLLGGFVTAFDDFLNNTGGNSISSLFSGLTLTAAKQTYAAANDGASSSADFVKVTVSAGETIDDLFFSDSSGNALNGDQVFLADGVTPMQTVGGDYVYLWSNGDYAIATTSSTAGAGEVVAAFYLNDNDPNHLQAQIQMVTFMPLMHPDGTNPDDALTFTNVLQVSAAGTVSFNFDNLPSGSFLYAAVGSTNAGILVTGQDLNVIDTVSKQGDMVKGGSDPSDSVNTSQGGIGATIGINSQHFTDISGSGGTRLDGAVGVFTLVKGFTSFDATINGTSEGTGTNVKEIGYTDYIDAPSAKIFISQVTGSSSIGGAVRITLWEAGGGDGGLADHAAGSLTPEQGYGTGLNAYIGNDDTDRNLTDDWKVAVGSVSVTRGNTTYTWTSGNSGSTQGGITVTIGTGATANAITIAGLITSDTIGFSALDTASPLDGTFNRFDVQALANSNPVDIGRIDLDQGVSISQGVGGNLVVQDDHPTISSTLSGAPTLTVDDSTLGTNDTQDFSGQFTPVYGTDGPGSTAVTYALSTSGGDSGLVESGTGLSVFLFKVGDNIVGKSGTDSANALASGTTVFVVSVDSAGKVTLDQQRAVVHNPDSGTDQSTAPLSAGQVVLTATAHDGDGDTASTGLNIGTLLNFKDDAPTITSQIQNGEVHFATDGTGTVTNSLNGSVGGDINNSSHQSLSGVEQYTITYWTTPTNVYPDLNAVLSADGTTLTYYSDLTDLNAVYQLSLNQTANSGAGSYTFTVLQPPPNTQTHFGFQDLPSGQNLDAIIAVDKTNIVGGVLPDGGLLVFPTNPDINDGDNGESNDGTMTNTSGTINTSKGGGPVTIGNGNQAFDNPGEGAWFMYVDNPNQSAVGTLGLTQVTADDADTIKFDGVNQATDASVTIVQASGAGTLKRPGPALHITTYEATPVTVNSETTSRNLVNDPTSAASNGGTPAPEVNIIGIKIHDATGAVVEYDTNPGGAGQVNGTPQDINGDGIADDTLVDIKFQQDAVGIYSAFIYNLKANYTVEFITATDHDLAKVEWVKGSFDIGGFNISNQQNIPEQDFSFAVQISDYDNDVYGGHSVAVANFGVTIDALNFV